MSNKRKFFELYNQGKKFYRMNKYDNAIDSYNRAIDVNSIYSDIWFHLGAAYRRKGDNNSFKEAYKKAFSIELKGGYKKDLKHIKRRQSRDTRELKIVIIFTSIILAIFLLPAVFLLGDTSFLLITIFISGFLIIALAGYIYKKTESDKLELKDTYKFYKKAILEYKESLVNDLENIEHWKDLITAYFDTKNFKKLIRSCKAALVIFLDNFEFLRLLGEAYYEIGKTEKSIKAYLKALEIEPEHSDLWEQLGQIYQEKEDYEHEIEYLIRALKNDSDDEYIIDKILPDLRSLIDSGDYEKGICFCNQILNINSKLERIWNFLGYIHFNIGSFDEAIETYEHALEINPEYNPAIHNLAHTYYKKKEYDKAITLIKRAIENDPDELAYCLPLSIIYLEKKDYEHAIEIVNKCLEIDPNHKDAKRLREEILKKIPSNQNFA